MAQPGGCLCFAVGCWLLTGGGFGAAEPRVSPAGCARPPLPAASTLAARAHDHVPGTACPEPRRMRRCPWAARALPRAEHADRATAHRLPRRCSTATACCSTCATVGTWPASWLTRARRMWRRTGTTWFGLRRSGATAAAGAGTCCGCGGAPPRCARWALSPADACLLPCWRPPFLWQDRPCISCALGKIPVLDMQHPLCHTAAAVLFLDLPYCRVFYP